MAQKKNASARAGSSRNAVKAPLYDKRQANRISLWVIIAVAIALAGYMAVELSTDPAQVSDGTLHVRALFGFNVSLADIRDLKLETTPIALGARIVGNDAFGLFREGDYQVDGLGKTRIFIKKPNNSYVTIQTADRSFAIGLGSLEKDQNLYDQIKLGMK
jgi:hypothetical protein